MACRLTRVLLWRQITEEAYNVCVQVMADVRKVMYLTLGGNTAVALPTIGTPPIKWSASANAQELWAVDAMRMCALAPMAACPQVSLAAHPTSCCGSYRRHNAMSAMCNPSPFSIFAWDGFKVTSHHNPPTPTIAVTATQHR